MNPRLAASAIVVLAAAAGASGGYALRAAREPWESLRKSEQLRFDALMRRFDRLAEKQETLLSTCADAAQVAQGSATVAHEGLAASGPAGQPGVASREPPEPDPVAEEALATGHRLIDRALSIGSWTDEDVIEFRHSTAPLNAQQQHELFTKLSRGINEGRIKFTGRGSPM
jgi:hypothetical protein